MSWILEHAALFLNAFSHGSRESKQQLDWAFGLFSHLQERNGVLGRAWKYRQVLGLLYPVRLA